MAKRLIDTNIFRDPWFMDLGKDGKLLWIYLFCNCDHAGIYEINKTLIRVETGITSIGQAFEQLGNRCVTVRQGLIFIPKFLYFQYPSFPNSKVKAQDSAIKILQENKLFLNGSLTLPQPLAKDYDNGNGNGSDIDSEDEFVFKADIEYRDIWKKWMEFRKAIKKQILPISEETAFKKLKELSGNSPDIAKKIIEQSIANGWQGLFELKADTVQKDKYKRFPKDPDYYDRKPKGYN